MLNFYVRLAFMRVSLSLFSSLHYFFKGRGRVDRSFCKDESVAVRVEENDLSRIPRPVNRPFDHSIISPLCDLINLASFSGHVDRNAFTCLSNRSSSRYQHNIRILRPAQMHHQRHTSRTIERVDIEESERLRVPIAGS